MSLTEFVFLGWRVTSPPDVCWLDCDAPGELELTQGQRRIVLCRRHAETLECGKYRGSYDGAPLPPDSIATSWPWMPAEQVA